MANIRQKNTNGKLATAMLVGLISAGTGGELIAAESRYGYAVPGVEFISTEKIERKSNKESSFNLRNQFSAIIDGLQTSSANLSRVLNFSRTTIYNWMKGISTPPADIYFKLDQLEKAAEKISSAGISAKSALALPIHQNMSFWDAFAKNGNAEEMIDFIISYRGERESQQKLVAERLAEKRKRGRPMGLNNDLLN